MTPQSIAHEMHQYLECVPGRAEIPVPAVVMRQWAAALDPRPVDVPCIKQPDKPLLRVARSQLYLTPAMVRQLDGCTRVLFTVEDGNPVFRPDLRGFAVTVIGNGGIVQAPRAVRAATRELGWNTQWLMERDKQDNCWRGRPVQV